MQKIVRAGSGWFTTVDDSNGELVSIHIDSLRQETRSGILPTAFVVSFSSFRGPKPEGDEVVRYSEDDLKRATKYKYKDDRELVFLLTFDAGANPVRVFDRIASILALVAIGRHTPMPYSEYVKYLATDKTHAGAHMTVDTAESPTGRVAVWDVMFTRKYGLVNGLFAIQNEQASFLAGYMSADEVLPGSLYQFPKGFSLSAEVQATNFIDIIQQVMDKVMEGDYLSQVEQYSTL